MYEMVWRLAVILLFLVPLGDFSPGSLLPLLLFTSMCFIAGILSMITTSPVCKVSFLTVVVPTAILSLYQFLQICPLPPTLLEALSHPTWKFYSQTVWVVESGRWMPLAVNPEATLRGILAIVAFGSLLLAVSSHCHDRKGCIKVVQELTLVVAVWAAVAIAITVLQAVLPHAGQSRYGLLVVVSERLNLMGVAFLPLVLSSYTTSRPKVTRLPFRMQVLDFLRAPSESPHIIACAAIILVSISVLPGANLLIISAIPVAWSGYLFLSHSNRSSGGLLPQRWKVMLLVITLPGFLWWGPELAASGRSMVSGAAQACPSDSSWLFSLSGFGLGGEADILRTTAIFTCGASETVRSAGLCALWLGFGLGGVFLAGLLAWAVTRAMRKCKSGRHAESSSAMFAGGICSTMLVIYLNYHLRILSWEYMLTAVWIGGILAFAATINQSRSENQKDVPKWLSKTIHSLLFIVICLALVCSALFYGGLMHVANIDQKVAALDSKGHPSDAVSELTDILEPGGLSWLPFLTMNSDLPMLHGSLHFYRQEFDSALNAFNDSMIRRPLDPGPRLALSGTYQLSGLDNIAVMLQKAEPDGYYSSNPFYMRMITTLLNGPVSEPVKGLVRIAVAGCPQDTGRYVSLMALSGWSDGDIRQTLPEHPAAWLAYGDVMSSMEKSSQAVNAYLHIIDIEPSGEPFEDVYELAAMRLLAMGNTSSALLVVETGIRLFPENTRLRQLFAEIIERL